MDIISITSKRMTERTDELTINVTRVYLLLWKHKSAKLQQGTLVLSSVVIA